MSRTLAVAFSLTTLTAAACTFGAYDAIVAYGHLNVADTAALAVSADATTLYAVDQQGTLGTWSESLKSFDAATGSPLGEVAFPSTWAVSALAPATLAGYEDSVWTLHANGYRIRYDASFSGYSEIEVPIPLTGDTSASARLYCDMDRADDVFYITTVDMGRAGSVAYLYREPSEGVWERVALPHLNGKCGRVAADESAGEVVVLDLALDRVDAFDAETLAAIDTTDVSGFGDDVLDVAATAGHLHLAVTVSGANDLLVSLDDTGALDDSTSVGSLAAIATHVDQSAGTGALVWSGMDTWPVKYTVGRFELGQ